ncbi:MAG: hypothetical protein PHD70_00255 [Anaerostipes sp.]|nr:hypothetical protein [Anaerostipes sp.]
MKEKPTTKICKHYKTEIPYDAKAIQSGKQIKLNDDTYDILLTKKAKAHKNLGLNFVHIYFSLLFSNTFDNT